MAKKFNIISNFKGYQSIKDITNLNATILVPESINMLANDAEKVSTRGGYSIFGAENTALTPILSSYDWDTSTNTQNNLRHYNGILEFYSRVSSAWETLMTGLSATYVINFATVWSSTEKIDLALFVNHDTNLYEWSGALTTYASSTSVTLTKQGANTWAQDRFLTAGTRSVRIKDDNGDWQTFTYTGGESTSTLTGVTPDPTTFTISPGNLAVQTVRTNTTTPASGFTNDLIEVLNNQVWVASLTRRDVYVSKNTSITDYTFASPRVIGEGALLTLDSTPVALVVQEEAMYISSGKNDWYQSKFTVDSSNTKEILSVIKLKTAPRQAAQSQALVTKIKNSVAFISNEPTLDTLGRLEQINTPQSKPLSFPIKPDFDAADFTGGQSIYFRSQILVSAPNDANVWIYDTQSQFWQPPQILPIARFSIIDGELYGHSSQVPETYKLFDGVNDNGKPINFVAAFAYRNFGDRVNRKEFNEYFSELYISSNTLVNLELRYNYKGASGVQDFDIDGSDDSIIFEPVIDNSLGINPLGQQPLGGSLDAPASLSKAEIIHTTRQIAFKELQAVYSSSDDDAQFQILAHGPAVRLSNMQRVTNKH